MSTTENLIFYIVEDVECVIVGLFVPGVFGYWMHGLRFFFDLETG